MSTTVSRSHVIADRYLTSPAALAARPFGPVDALDTHSGRGAQVRIVFVAGDRDEADLADGVARWCGIGCSEVCGVLDFGRHADRWFLVLPPSAGLPVERWRMLRRPTAADAARLTLACGRVTERVAAAGFSPDAAVIADVAVGPGPTPFLERPLLHAASLRAVAPGDGQRILAAVCDAALGPVAPPAGLGEWAARARAGEFAGLAECLDELERSQVAGDGEAAPASDLAPGLGHLFDDDFDLDGPAVTSPPPRRFRRLAVGLPIVTFTVLGLSALFGGHSSPASATLSRPAAPAVRPVVTPASEQNPVVHTKAPHHHHHRTVRVHRHHSAAKVATPAQATSPPAAVGGAVSPPRPTGSGGAVVLSTPSPVGVTLPAP
jgi:hypothetical protein